MTQEIAKWCVFAGLVLVFVGMMLIIFDEL